MQESLYSALRDELITMEERQVNVTIQMYVLCATIIGLGIQFGRFIFLLSYLIIIPCESIVARAIGFVSKLSWYIRLFIENEPSSNIYWETFNSYEPLLKYEAKSKKSIEYFLYHESALVLSCLTFIIYVIFTIIELSNGSPLWYKDPVEHFINFTSILLFCISIGVYLNIKKFKKSCSNEYRYIILQYKTYLQEQSLQNI